MLTCFKKSSIPAVPGLTPRSKHLSVSFGFFRLGKEPSAMTQQHSTASPVHSQFPVWRTIQIGTGLKTANDFRRALTSAGYRIGTWANDILGRFTPATEEKKLDLVAVSVAELGFANGATLRDIYARAKELGLELCPAEVG